MTHSLNSLELVEKLEAEIILKVRQLKSEGVDIHLAAIVVGEDDHFVELKQRRGRPLGIETSIYRLPASSLPEDVISVIGFLNVDQAVHGILVQLPLPKSFTTEQTDQIINAIAPAKDVDGLSAGRDKQPAKSLSDLVRATHLRHRFLPTTAWAMLSLADHNQIDLHNAVIVGNGRLVGQALHQLLEQLKIKHQVVDLNTPDLATIIAQADVILAGTDTDKPIFNRTTVKKDAQIIAAGQEIDHLDLENWATSLTPTKGGVGPLTITHLFNQTVIAASTAHGR
jgi:methylenetetrahydrofolate dehydrogenase (NADP+)/methenyltetrahydrofolate cyclohydrolase